MAFPVPLKSLAEARMAAAPVLPRVLQGKDSAWRGGGGVEDNFQANAGEGYSANSGGASSEAREDFEEDEAGSAGVRGSDHGRQGTPRGQPRSAIAGGLPGAPAAQPTGRHPSARASAAGGAVGVFARGPAAVRGAASGRAVGWQIANGAHPWAHDPVASFLSAIVDNQRGSKRRRDEQATPKREELRAQRIATMSQPELSDPTNDLYKDSLEKELKEQ